LKEWFKKIFKNTLALLIGLMIAFFIGEIVLRIWHPIDFRVKGDKIVLPCNKKYIIRNTKTSKLDTLVIHSKNSLGFRGKEKPVNYDDLLSIITIGGSTTECYYISDGNDWPGVLEKKLSEKYNNIWINNAGLDGQSTFGHSILLNDYVSKLKPKYILYLTGCNEIGREDLSKYDKDKLQDEYQSVGNFFTKNSELVDLVVNIARGLRARKENLIHEVIDFKNQPHVKVDSTVLNDLLSYHKTFTAEYKKRLTALIQKTKEYNIKPILITQSTVVGKATDEATGTDLATIKLMNSNGGYTYQRILEKYNEVTRAVAKEQNIPLIELGNKMPKNSRYYVDGIHYTNDGAQKVGEIIFECLDSILVQDGNKRK
jgi:lysophospholipase L1-like esterase